MIVGGSSIILKVGADLTKFDRAMSSVKGRVSGLGRTLAGPFKFGALAVVGFTAALGAAITALGTGGVIAAAKFEKAFAEVKTILDKSKWDISRAQQDIMKMSRDIGSGLIDTTKGLYQVVSAGFSEQADAMGVLRQSMKLGVAGLTSTEQSVDAITTTLNAYGLSASDAQYVSDLLFTTVKLGKTRMEELSSSIGRVLPVAANLGVSLEELFGALATLTKQGLSTEEAVTALRAILSGIAKPSSEATELAQKMGISFDLVALKSKGLAGFMRDLTKELKGDEQAWTTLFGNIRGLLGVMGIGGAKLDAFVGAVGELGASAGATGDAYAEMEKTLAHQWKKFVENMMQSVTVFGDNFTPLMRGVFRGVNKVVSEELDELTRNFGHTATNTEEQGAQLGEAIGRTIAASLKTLDKSFESIEKGITDNIDHFKQGFDNITYFLNELLFQFDEIGPSIEGTLGHIAASFENISSILSTHAPAIVNYMKDIAGAIEKVGGVIEWVTGKLREMANVWNAMTASTEELGFASPGDMILAFSDMPYKTSKGRYIPGKQYGGWVEGPPGKDKVPGLLTKDEFVVRDKPAKIFGPLLEKINAYTGNVLPNSIKGIKSALAWLSGGEYPTTGREEGYGAGLWGNLIEKVQALWESAAPPRMIRQNFETESPAQGVIDALMQRAGGAPVPAMAPVTDNSNFNLHLSFNSNVDRETVNKVIVPQIQRAWEIGSIRRQRGIR